MHCSGGWPTDHPEAYTRSQRGVVTPLVEYWTGSARLHLWIMLGASLLLLIASVISASNLLLSRTLSRRSEIATRLALGAGRRQILAQLGTEGALVAIVAAALPEWAWRNRRFGFWSAGRRGTFRDYPNAALDLGGFGFAAGAGGIGCHCVHGDPRMVRTAS